MKKRAYKIFIIICIAICALPLVGMIIRPTTETTDNRAMKTFPSLSSNQGGVNLKFFEEFEDYFNDRFAFRNELVYADAKIQSSLFRVSAVDGVILGTDGWLYYKSTLPDYLGTGKLSDRELYNLAHNLSLIDGYLKAMDKDFLFTVPPNKNTLYGNNMPYYYSHKVGGTHNIERLAPVLAEKNIPYADLLKLFEEESEVLYLKRDSHWNNKGALLAYNEIMDGISHPHDDYMVITPNRSMGDLGDLNKMLYTFYGDKELNYSYDIPFKYSYSEGFQSVEDGFIETTGGSGRGTLLMFRDSFGNTLIPFIAEQYEKAWFSKGMPHSLESYIEKYNPDSVIFEKVERNLADYITMPPIISSPEVKSGIEVPALDSQPDGANIFIQSLDFDFNYYKIGGEIKESLLSTTSDVVVEVNGKQYHAFQIGDNGYEIYIKKDSIASFPLGVKVIVIDDASAVITGDRVLEERDVK